MNPATHERVRVDAVGFSRFNRKEGTTLYILNDTEDELIIGLVDCLAHPKMTSFKHFGRWIIVSLFFRMRCISLQK